MPSILNLKFKGNKSFVAFSNLNDTESLTKTWKVCTKVASYLEQGQRLENLSWRLWHLQNLMVDTDNAKSKREFKKLSKCMGDKLDKEKGRSIEELEAPDFKRNHSTDMIRQRAVEKERSREASHNAQPGTIKRMQFTFSVDQQAHQAPSSTALKKPDTRPSAEFTKRTRAAAARAQAGHEDSVMADGDVAPSTPTAPPSSSSSNSNSSTTWSSQFLHFPPIFGAGFGPSALLYAAPTLTNPMNYGEGFDPSGANESFSISRPTIELPLDEILFGDESTGWVPTHEVVSSNNTSINNSNNSISNNTGNSNNGNKRKNSNTNSTAGQRDVIMQSTPAPAPTPAPAAPAPLTISLPKKNASHSSSINKTNVAAISSSSSIFSSSDEEEEEEEEYIPTSAPAPSSSKRNSVYKNIPPLSQTVKEVLPETVAPSRITSSIYGTRSNTPTSRPHLTVRTQGTVNTRSSGPGATATSLNSAVLRGGGSGNSETGNSLSNSAPGGVKAECSNCGATHTPLWRRGLNDELNCNACGLYCKLHKRPRPKSMRNSHVEGRAQVAPRQETVDVISSSPLAAQCYNCHTTATPLWRKDDEGKTVCNACGLYYKLHGSTRPISMKSDVIRKRSRHDARRASITGPEDTPSNSSGPSRLNSPAPEASPTLAPDSTTQLSYDFEDSDAFRAISAPSSSELMGALGALTGAGPVNHVADSTTHRTLYQAPSSPYHPLSSALTSSSGISLYPGPYHPDYLMQFSNVAGDALPFSSVDSVEIDATMSPRSNKRRRMSMDSAEDPPQSAVSFGSFSGPTGDSAYNSTVSSASHGHSLSHTVTRGHSHSFSLSHSHSHSLSSQVHSHSLSHSHGHAKRSSMEFPFTNYNANGTINSGPVLRGSGNTFWHPPMLPQTGSDNEGHLFHAHGSSSSSNNNNGNSNNSNSSNSAANESGVNGGSGGRTTGGGRSEDSAMDYLHPLPMLQDEDNLFSTFVHPPMALPEEVGPSGGDGNDANMHTSMYVDSSSYYQ